jgi:hypothetical protein
MSNPVWNFFSRSDAMIGRLQSVTFRCLYDRTARDIASLLRCYDWIAHQHRSKSSFYTGMITVGDPSLSIFSGVSLS